jgi:hypothetical protein
LVLLTLLCSGPVGASQAANGRGFSEQSRLAEYCGNPDFTGRKAYEQLNALEFERTEDRVRYICSPGQHDDLAMSLAMLAWAADHRDFMEVRVRPIEDRHRPKANRQKFGWKSFV